MAGGPAAPPPAPSPPSDGLPKEAPAPEPVLPARLPPAERTIAIGDVHGDYGALVRVLRAAGVVDEDVKWSGGNTVVVQVGDLLDRGDDEVRVLYALERLGREAARAGGALHVLTGNHESMNIAGDMRYATAGATASFARLRAAQRVAAGLKAAAGCAPGWSAEAPPQSVRERYLPLDAEAHVHAGARRAELATGAPFTRRFLAPHPAALAVGDVLFVHGGLLPEHAALGLERLNAETRAWMEGRAGAAPPPFLTGRDALVWSRRYSVPEGARCECGTLRDALRVAGAARMVVGHTIQGAGVNSACDGHVIRVDVGMSRGCGGHSVQALEVLAGGAVSRILADGTREPLEGTPQERAPAWGVWPRLRVPPVEVAS